METYSKVKSLRYFQVVVSTAQIILPSIIYLAGIISPLNYIYACTYFSQETIGDANISLMDSLRS
jgi:hypothetical protein